MHRSHLLRWFALVLALFSFQCLESLSDDCRKTRTCEAAPQLGADCRWYYPDGGVWTDGPRRTPEGLWVWPNGTQTKTQDLECPLPDGGLLVDGGGVSSLGNCPCDPGLVCDESSNRCVKCLDAVDCNDESHPDVGQTPVCDPRVHVCVACLNDTDCAPVGPELHCKLDSNPAKNRCVQCLTSRPHCNGSEVCDTNSNECTATCTGAGQCKEPKPVCSNLSTGSSTGLCIQCFDNMHCSGATPQCNTARKECVQCVDNTVCPNGQVCGTGNRCVQCVEDTTCGGELGKCDTATNTCVACLNSSQCISVANSRCNAAHECTSCTDNTQCEADFPVCNTMTGRCVSCVDDTTCMPGVSVCDTASGSCVACVGNNDCNRDVTAARCNTAAHTCEPCTSPTQCSGKFGVKDLCSAGECVECTTNGDCAGDVTKSRCDTNTHLCARCQADPDCGSIVGARACTGGNNARCVECTNATHCVGNPDGLACNTATNSCVECVVDADCTAPGTSRCVANQCQPCVNDGGGTHCGHVRSGARTLGVCDTSAGAAAGVCVECTGNQRAACNTTVCNSLTKACSTFAVGSAGTCLDCVSDAHCAAGDRCVLETFAGTELGYSCFNLKPAGTCPGGPYEGDASVTTIDGAAADVCLLRRSTCAAVNQSPSRPCTVDTDCGEPNLDDGRCDTSQGLCSLPCASALDCTGGANSTCSVGVCLL